MTDWFTESFGVAVDDIRAKLIDEGWFGRHTAERSQQHGLGWSVDDHPREPGPAAHDDPGHDFDR